jgi:hypothetical protein
MTLRTRAEELDDRFVPIAAARLRRWVDALAGWRSVLDTRRSQVRSQVRTALPTQVRDIRPADLDARYAGTGPLATVREIPQIGFVLIAAVFMAGTATAVVRHQPDQAAEQLTESPVVGEPPVPASNRLGPDVGQKTDDYEQTSHGDLEKVADKDPDGRRVALVTFSDYRTPAQVEQALADLDVRRVYLRAKDAGPEAAPVPYELRPGQLAAGLQKAYNDVALSRLELRRSYLAYVATTKNDPVYQKDYQRYADSAGREVTAYQHSCACVFSALVEAPAERLLDLWTNPDVRAVQVAGKGVDPVALVVLPLLPETNGTVPEPAPTPAP